MTREELKLIRNKIGDTQKEFSEKLDMSLSTYKALESGSKTVKLPIELMVKSILQKETGVDSSTEFFSNYPITFNSESALLTYISENWDTIKKGNVISKLIDLERKTALGDYIKSEEFKKVIEMMLRVSKEKGSIIPKNQETNS